MNMISEDLIELARRVLDANRAAGKRIAVAESCTGGLVSAALTELPGASDVFEAGFVTYSDQSKEEVLNVHRDVLDTFGAVSIAVAWAMAQGALARSTADVAVAITGIPGPAGGSETTPVGSGVFARARRAPAPKAVLSCQTGCAPRRELFYIDSQLYAAHYS